LSATNELDELRDKRAKLEKESLLLKQGQKNLEERIKVLEEKIAIEELKKDNRTARENVSHLESTISELERKLLEAGHSRYSSNSETPKRPEQPTTTFVRPVVSQQTVGEGLKPSMHTPPPPPPEETKERKKHRF
jgi:L-lactate utilization protein LutB